MNNDSCDKIILANGAGARLIYCKNCDVVELEIGVISLRFSAEQIQQIANTVMKASLRLDRMTVPISHSSIARGSALH
jgi:hypothetical protein